VFLLTGFFETFGAGWVYGLENQVTKFGPALVLTYMITHFGSIIIACGFWFGLNNDNEVWGGFIALFLCAIAGLVATGVLLSQKMATVPGKWTWKSIVYELTLGNVMELRDELSSVVGYLPWVWAFAMKNMIPQILLILFINLATSKNDADESLFGHYEGYIAWPFQILGILIVCFAGLFILVGAAAPQVFEAADIPAKASTKQIEQASDSDAPSGEELEKPEVTSTDGVEFNA
jgi:hypothetical protein